MQQGWEHPFLCPDQYKQLNIWKDFNNAYSPTLPHMFRNTNIKYLKHYRYEMIEVCRSVGVLLRAKLCLGLCSGTEKMYISTKSTQSHSSKLVCSLDSPYGISYKSILFSAFFLQCPEQVLLLTLLLNIGCKGRILQAWGC